MFLSPDLLRVPLLQRDFAVNTFPSPTTELWARGTLLRQYLDREGDGHEVAEGGAQICEHHDKQNPGDLVPPESLEGSFEKGFTKRRRLPESAI